MRCANSAKLPVAAVGGDTVVSPQPPMTLAVLPACTGEINEARHDGVQSTFQTAIAFRPTVLTT